MHLIFFIPLFIYFLFKFIILHKGTSLLFHCHQKQVYKIGDPNSKVAFKTVMDRHTDQRTHGAMRGREAWEGVRLYKKIDTLMK